MKFVCLALVVFVLVGCGRKAEPTLVGTWLTHGTQPDIVIEIRRNSSDIGDLLTARVNGVTVQYPGTLNDRIFIGTGTDVTNPRPREGRYPLAEIDTNGDLICNLLNSSQIRRGTVLKKAN